MDENVKAVLKQRGLDVLGMVYDEKVGDMVMHASFPELSRYSIPRQLQDFQPFGHTESQEGVTDLMAVKKNGWLFYAFTYEFGLRNLESDEDGPQKGRRTRVRAAAPQLSQRMSWSICPF
jgi:hypothetical protein